MNDEDAEIGSVWGRARELGAAARELERPAPDLFFGLSDRGDRTAVRARRELGEAGELSSALHSIDRGGAIGIGGCVARPISSAGSYRSAPTLLRAVGLRDAHRLEGLSVP